MGVLLGPGERQGGLAEPLGTGGWAWVGVKSEKGGVLRKRAGPWVRALLFLREMETETEGETEGGPPPTYTGRSREKVGGRERMEKREQGGHTATPPSPPDLCLLQRKETSPGATTLARGSGQKVGAGIRAPSGWCPVIIHLQSPTGGQAPSRTLSLRGP